MQPTEDRISLQFLPKFSDFSAVSETKMNPSLRQHRSPVLWGHGVCSVPFLPWLDLSHRLCRFPRVTVGANWLVMSGLAANSCKDLSGEKCSISVCVGGGGRFSPSTTLAGSTAGHKEEAEPEKDRCPLFPEERQPLAERRNRPSAGSDVSWPRHSCSGAAVQPLALFP